MSSVLVSKTPLRQVKDVRELLSNENARNQLASVAAKHMNPERMMRVVSNAIQTTPKLREAEPLSMLGALMNCAALGLEPNTPLGYAYLIPFDRTLNRGKPNEMKITEVQVIVGYKGFIDLARRSGSLVSIHADVVYDDDEHFSHEYGSNQHLKHVTGPRKGKKLGAYCHIKVKNGDMTGEGHVYMAGDEILGVRDKSQGWLSARRFNKTAESPWVAHEDRMWAKTAVRRIANSGELPMSIEFMQALEVDDSRVDYASYAMNPNDGLTIDAEANEVDEIATDQAAKAVEKPKPERRMEPEREREAVSGGADARPGDQSKNTDREASGRGEDPEVWESFKATVLRDLVESGEPDEVANFYAERLEQMKVSAPAIHAEVMAEIERMRGGTARGQAAMDV